MRGVSPRDPRGQIFSKQYFCDLLLLSNKIQLKNKF